MPTKKKKADSIALEMGRRLAEARKQRGWTQAQLAEATGWTQESEDAGRAKGFSPSRIGNYEQGTRRFKIEEAEVFGEVFGLPSAYFMVVLDEEEADVIVAMRRRREPPQKPTRHRQPK